MPKLNTRKSLLFTVLLGALLIVLFSSVSAETTQPTFDCSTVTDVPQIECEALVALYNSTDGDNWSRNTNWLATTSACDWFGVICENGNIVVLALAYNLLSGLIPAELGDLTNLNELHLRNNLLSGSIPAELGDLTNLTFLSIRRTHLSGSIPVELGELTNLTYLSLRDNQLSGSIPVELGELTNLTFLSLDGNQLSGSIPAELGELTNLTYLSLHDNQLSGSIPAELGHLTNLTALFLSNTQLSGSIPAELGNLTNLTELFLSYNQLSGSIPAELGDLTNLEQLSLNSNQLSGSIPAELVNLTNLGSLNLGENQLSGSISAELGKLSDLGRLELAENQLSGSIPAELGDLTNLTSLILDSNQLSGSIPAELGNISSLHDLYLNNNQLSGSIPVSFASSHIRKFTYFNTTICVPNNDIIHDWLDRIYNHGAGLECDQATGLISGKVTGQSNDPHPNISVTLYQDFSSGGFDFDYALIDNVETDAYGYYQFDGLGNGEYILRFRDPSGTYSTEYYNNQFTIDDAESVTVTLGNTINVDAVLDDLTTTPPVAEVTAGSGSITPNPADGSSIVNMPRGNATDINVSMAATCDDNSTPSAVFLRIKNANQEYGSYANLSMIQDSGNDYVVTVPIGIITFSNNTFTVRVVCAEGDERTLVATVRLYDPMGIIRDEFTGEPIEGAKVFLFRVPDWYPKTGSDDDRANTCQSNRSKSADASWNQSAPTELGVWVDPVVKAISPETAVQLTDNEGYYGWDVSIGCWYVIVEAVGYKPMVSPVVGVHPAVTDLHLQLEPYVYNNHIFLPTINR